MSSDEGTFGDLAAALAGMEQNPDLVVVVQGPQLEIRAVNAVSRGWLSGRDVLGLPLAEAFAELMGRQIIDLYESCYRTGERYQRDGRLAIDAGAGARREVEGDFAVVPWLAADGTVVGVIGTASDLTERAARSQRDLREGLDVITALQDLLLPPGLPIVPGADLAATYLLGAREASAGGDWFDAVVRPAGRLALVVGDVAGHGNSASAVMGQLRAVLHQQLLAGVAVSDALVVLDEFARSVPEARAATVCVAELTPSTGQVDYSTAGHPPPLLVSTDGEARYLPPTGSAPLATGPGTYPTERAQVDDRELLLLYTDGLVERPGRSLSQNTLDLVRTAGDSYLNRVIPAPDDRRVVDRVCEQVLDVLTRASGYVDDIALLAVQRGPAPHDLECILPAAPAAVGAVRSRIADWLDGLAARPLDITAIQTAVGELVTNAVEHAYDGPDASAHTARAVHVTAALLETGDVRARVVDTGTWRPPGQPDHRERGLAISRGIVDHLDLQHGHGGTTVTVTHRVTRPAQLLTAVNPPADVPMPGHETPFSVEVDPGGRTARVAGPIDLLSADDLRIALLHATCGGARPLQVDLTEVTVLASAGVQVLHEVQGHGRPGLFAPAGSPAQHVLELVGLPYTLERPPRD